MLGKQNNPTPRLGLPPETRRALILVLWPALMCCVVIGSLLPAASPVIADIGRLHINDKVMHFCAYLALSLLPVIGFQDRRHGLKAGLSMFLLDVLMEAGQHFSPGRAVELGDVLANGAGVSCGAPLPLAFRACITILRPARNSLPRGIIPLTISIPRCDPPGRRFVYAPDSIES